MKHIKRYSELNFLTKFKELFFNPKNFFKLIKSEKNIRPAVFTSLIAYSIFLIWFRFFNYEVIYTLVDTFDLRGIALSYLVLVGFLSFFVISFLLKVFSNLLGSKNNFTDFYKIIVYSYLPYGLFGFIPFVVLWTIVLSIIGLKSITKFSTLKSIGIFLLASIALTIITMIFQSLIFI